MKPIEKVLTKKQKELSEKKMPLKKGKKNIGKNIETELKHGKSRKQAVAIALSVAKVKKKKKSKKKMK